MNSLVRFVKNESAATAIEYAMIASLVSVVIVVAVNALGVDVSGTFTTLAAAFK